MKGFITVAATLTIALVTGIYIGRAPRELADREAQKLRELQAKVQATEAKHSELAKREAQLRSPKGYEAFARSRGYIGANEVSAPPVASDAPR